MNCLMHDLNFVSSLSKLFVMQVVFRYDLIVVNTSLYFYCIFFGSLSFYYLQNYAKSASAQNSVKQIKISERSCVYIVKRQIVQGNSICDTSEFSLGVVYAKDFTMDRTLRTLINTFGHFVTLPFCYPYNKCRNLNLTPDSVSYCSIS